MYDLMNEDIAIRSGHLYRPTALIPSPTVLDTATGNGFAQPWHVSEGQGKLFRSGLYH